MRIVKKYVVKILIVIFFIIIDILSGVSLQTDINTVSAANQKAKTIISADKQKESDINKKVIVQKKSLKKRNTKKYKKKHKLKNRKTKKKNKKKNKKNKKITKDIGSKINLF